MSNKCGSYAWAIVPGSIIITMIVRLILYATLSPDLGLMVILHSDEGTHPFLFLGASTAADEDRILRRMEQLTNFVGDRRPVVITNLTLDSEVDNILLDNYYLDTSHPCQSFYDSVCGVEDSLGTGTNEEDTVLTTTNPPASTGTFAEVTKFSQALTTSLLERNVYYQACIKAAPDKNRPIDWTHWNNIEVPDNPISPSQMYRMNVTTLGIEFLAQMITRGLQTPLEMSIVKVFHEPVFGLEVNFNMLPMLDLTFHLSLISETFLLQTTSDGATYDRPTGLMDYYDKAFQLNPLITTQPESPGEYIGRCRNISTLKPATRYFLARIFPNISKVTYLCAFHELDDVVSLLVHVVGVEPLVYWDYFHRLSAYYHVLPYMRDEPGVVTNQRIPVAKLPRTDWILTMFYPLKAHNNTKTYSYGGRKFRERFSHGKWESDLVENVEYKVVYHMASHEFELTVSKQESYTGYEHSSQEGDEINPVVAFCSQLTQAIDRFWLNAEFSALNEIHYEEGNALNRSLAVAQLVRRVLNATRDLVLDSQFQDARTQNLLISKLNHVVIRVKGIASACSGSAEQWGFNPIYSPTHQMTTYSPTTILFTGLYNHLANLLHLSNVRLMAMDYIAFRSDPQFYQWEDLEVPYEIVNAWYDPLENTITIPIGITLLPMFRNLIQLDDSLLGVITAHELGHALDNNGRLFGPYGDYMYNGTADYEQDDGLWFGNDFTMINESMNCLAKDYGHPCDRGDYGYHTMGEDIADQVGVRSGLSLLMNTVYRTYKNQYAPVEVTRTSLLKEFFINYAKLWCGRASISRQCSLVKRDPHALAKHRVNKTLRQIAEFVEAFKCRPGSHMYRPANGTCLIYK